MPRKHGHGRLKAGEAQKCGIPEPLQRLADRAIGHSRASSWAPFPERPIDGCVEDVDPTLQAEARKLEARIAIPNAEGRLKPACSRRCGSRRGTSPSGDALAPGRNGRREACSGLPEMSAQELHAFMPEHRRRVMSVMEMHRTMMGRI